MKPSSADGRDAPMATGLDAFRMGLNERERQLFDRQRSEARARLMAHHRPERVLEAAASAISFGAPMARRQLDVVRSSTESACREGCHWCCHLKVSVTAAEVFLIANYLEQSAPHGQLEAVRTRAAELAKDERIFSADAKAEAHIPCALLTKQGACGVYALRPLACRGWNSADSEACRRFLDNDEELVPMHEGLTREYAALGLGLLAALRDARLPTEILELTSALHIALSDPNALDRWLNCEPIFSGANAER